MATLREENTEIMAARTASGMLQNSEELREQEITVTAELVTLKSKLQTDLAQNEFVKADFIAYVRADDILSHIAGNLPNIKTELAILKVKIKNASHKIEIQNEIDLL